MVPRDWSDGSRTRNGKLVAGGGGGKGAEQRKKQQRYFSQHYMYFNLLEITPWLPIFHLLELVWNSSSKTLTPALEKWWVAKYIPSYTPQVRCQFRQYVLKLQSTDLLSTK